MSLEEAEEVETPPPPPPPPPSPAAENLIEDILAFLTSAWWSVNWYLVVLIVLLLAELVRPRREQPAATATATVTRRTLAAGQADDAALVAEALTVTDLNRFVDHLRRLEDRSKAVLLVYVYAALGHDGIPARDAQTTPHEWLSTIAAQNKTTAAAATELVEQYVRVRFGDQRPTEQERLAAIDSLAATFASATGHSVP